jgi:hypothetical protein
MATKSEVELFLQQLKSKMLVYEIVFRPRDKNNDTIATLDILPKDRIDYIKNLKVEDYYAGPTKDTYDPQRPEYYEFGIIINGAEVYVKISLGLTNKPIDCMSFHIAERAIRYPFKI